MQRPLLIGRFGFVVPLLWLPVEAQAHGFAVRYDLPIPLGFYLAGAGATVALSFLLLAFFAGARPAPVDRRPGHRVSRRAGRILSNNWVAGTLQGISVALFLLIVATASFGDENPFNNISTTFVWVIWWVGMMFVNTFIGDIWALVNPWDALFGGAERVLSLLKPGARLSLERPFPERFGVWPAVVLFMAFAWMELISGEGEAPRQLAVAVISYSLVTWTGMMVFGRRIWLVHGEAFAVVFSTFARFAPAAFQVGGAGGRRYCAHGMESVDGATIGCAACFETAPPAERAVALRLPGAGLLVQRPVSMSVVAMVLTLLATVTFDGLLATPAWVGIYEYFTDLSQLRWWRAPWMAAALNFHVVATALFLLLPLGFAAVFLACCRLTAAVAGEASTARVAGCFALTLLPIAIAYHLAHYMTYFLLSGQYIIPAASDPFGFGWDLFGTAFYKPDIEMVGARFAWYTAVIAIVTGHMIAVYLAHRTALRLFGGGSRTLASQLPMVALMVAYTMLSLWIIAQPTVR
jgi:hypothetical protein